MVAVPLLLILIPPQVFPPLARELARWPSAAVAEVQVDRWHKRVGWLKEYPIAPLTYTQRCQVRQWIIDAEGIKESWRLLDLAHWQMRNGSIDQAQDVMDRLRKRLGPDRWIDAMMPPELPPDLHFPSMPN